MTLRILWLDLLSEGRKEAHAKIGTQAYVSIVRSILTRVDAFSGHSGG